MGSSLLQKSSPFDEAAPSEKIVEKSALQAVSQFA
jgi:hypothetical protein